MPKITRKYKGQTFKQVLENEKEYVDRQWNLCVVCTHDTPSKLPD
jgi:hypothetical protein